MRLSAVIAVGFFLSGLAFGVPPGNVLNVLLGAPAGSDPDQGPGRKQVKMLVRSSADEDEDDDELEVIETSPEDAMAQLRVMLMGLEAPIEYTIAGGRLILAGVIKTQSDRLKFEAAIERYPDVISSVRIEAPELMVSISATLIEVEVSSGHGVSVLQTEHGVPFNADFNYREDKDWPHSYYGGDVTSRGLSWGIGVSAQLLSSMKALFEKGKARVVATPRVVTVQGERASLLSGAEVPYTSSSWMGSNTEFKPVGVRLNVIPELLPSGEVLMDLTVESSNRELDMRRARMQVAVEKGKSLVVAGLSSSTTSKSRRFGCFFPLFGSGASVRKTELLVVVTPDAPSIVGFDKFEMIKPEDLKQR